MDLNDLNFTYPSDLIATERSPISRVMYCGDKKDPTEINKKILLDKFQKNDCLVINDSKVVKRRIMSLEKFEILFIEEQQGNQWSVLFPSSRLKKNQILNLPDGVELALIEGGIPQRVQINKKLNLAYFENHGQMAIPPYIQKERGLRQNKPEDETWYQTDWAESPGSCAAPTASLHFNNEDLELLKAKGVHIAPVTLHVGLGTFLPIRELDIQKHKMHSEHVSISKQSLDQIEHIKTGPGRIWAMGTTAARALESLPFNYFQKDNMGNLSGQTDLFLYPGKQINYVDILMTNFHQPGSTLLALVSAFSSIENVRNSYQWAIKNEFKLFSYGDLSVWERN